MVKIDLVTATVKAPGQQIRRINDLAAEAVRLSRRLPAMARFDGVMATFWGDGDYYVQQPLMDEMVREAERALGVRLPSALLDLLRIQNGGIVASDHDAFPTSQPTSWSEDHVPFDSLMGIGRRDGMTSLLDTPYLVEEWGMPAPLVLLSGDGHYWIGLDYRTCGRDGEPSVTWFETDLATEFILAGDFCSFVEGLIAGSTYGDGSAGGSVLA
ncbi:SMI1/KNR4 family protein [Streptomyces sp. AC555_RSS877]|uniref:SMI1/KNR4 family protein n=1 Tax=Streptomyces sp. AC555_RSS877 TaxID=2823688 RepID=UPI0027E530ED|nr:SMI1/KNR4 family protein [Streptomyces sp. AC555_RSS877]